MQAPVSMKAMCVAVYCIVIAFGNLLVIIIAESNFFQNRVSNDSITSITVHAYVH